MSSIGLILDIKQIYAILFGILCRGRILGKNQQRGGAPLQARLVFEDGRIFVGRAFGAEREAVAEVVFNTAMAGYQETFTDPSYAGQILTMTYPLIGNYGINSHDMESKQVQISGLVVKELCRWPSNFQSQQTLEEWLIAAGIPGIEGVDTRAITRLLRETGSKNGILTTSTESADLLIRRAKEARHMAGLELVRQFTCTHASVFNSEMAKPAYEVALLDCGAKTNIARELAKRGCRVHILPATSSSAEILACRPDGFMLSNGPGDPAAVTYAIATLRELIGRLPIFGICLGHQLLSLAIGAKTIKLKFGHRGVNHPVKDILTGKVAITSQNHGFCVDPESLPKEMEITHMNLNDQTIEGMRHRSHPVFSVQYHPEAAPGPHDASYLFDRFITLMAAQRSRTPIA
jgi:carbamoyl-phosphate synthase small subunit